MDEEERQRRMQELQMADLGTARREYISTVDLPNKYRHVGLDQIEAIRAANMIGSEAQKSAEVNKAQLSAWNNAHHTIGGDVQLEGLDEMMSGQSHRAQLCDTIRAKGGQAYIHNPAAPPKGPSRNAHSARTVKGLGREGGVARSRGCAGFSKTPLVSKTTTSPRVLANIGNHPVESLPGQRRYLDPALHLDTDENFPGKKGKLVEITATSQASKSDRGFHGRGRAAGTVKTRRVVDPSANFEAMLAGPSDFMAVAKAHSVAISSTTPEPTQSAETQSLTAPNDTKQENIAKEEVCTQEGTSHNDAVLEVGIKGRTEIQENKNSSLIVAEERDVRGAMLLEQDTTNSTAANTWAIQVVSPPFDSIGTRPTNLGEQKADKGFRSSLPKPLLASEQSTLLIDLMRKSRPPSSPASPLRSRDVNSGNNKASRSSSLDITPQPLQMLLPDVPASSTCADKPASSQGGTSNGAMKDALDLLIHRLQFELDQVNQIIDNSSEPVESTGIGAYLLSRKQQLKREIAEAIEMETDIVLPFSALTLEDTSDQQRTGKISTSQEILTPEQPNTSMDKKEESLPFPFLECPLVSSDPPNIAPRQASFMSSHTPPTPIPISSTSTSSACNLIGDHLLPGRYSSSAKPGPETLKVMSGNCSLHGFSTTHNAPAMREPIFVHAAGPVDHNYSINQSQVRDTPNTPDNATTWQSPPRLSQPSAEPWNVHAPVQQNTPFVNATQQHLSYFHHSTEQSGLLSYPITSTTTTVQSLGVPSQSQHAAQITQSLFSATSTIPQESGEQSEPVELSSGPKFPMSAATMQYTGALFLRQEDKAAPSGAPASQPLPCGLGKPATSAFVSKFPVSDAMSQHTIPKANVRTEEPRPPMGQENCGSYPARTTPEVSKASNYSPSNPPRLSGLQNSQWATPAGIPTSPKSARKKAGAPQPRNQSGGISMFAAEMARHGVVVSKRTIDESTTDSGPSKRQKESPSFAISK